MTEKELIYCADFIENEELRIGNELPASIADFIKPSIIKDLSLMLDNYRIDMIYTDLVEAIASSTAKANLKDFIDNKGYEAAMAKTEGGYYA